MAGIPPEIIDLQAQPEQDAYLSYAKSNCNKVNPHYLAEFYRGVIGRRLMAQHRLISCILPRRCKSIFSAQFLKNRQPQNIVSLISDDEEKEEPSVLAKIPRIGSAGRKAQNQGNTSINAEAMVEESKIELATQQKPPAQQGQIQPTLKASRSLKLKGIFKRQRKVKTVKLKNDDKRGRVETRKIQRVSSHLRNQCVLSLQELKRLQLSLLREMGPEILTGPQFQVQIQPFIFQSCGLSEYLGSVREDLLMRLQRQNDDQ